MDETKAQVRKSLDRVENLLVALKPEVAEDLNWFFQIVANSHWEDVKYASTWDDTLAARARAEWIQAYATDVRGMLEQLRDGLEAQLDEPDDPDDSGDDSLRTTM